MGAINENQVNPKEEKRHMILKGVLLSSFEFFLGTIRYRPSKQTKRESSPEKKIVAYCEYKHISGFTNGSKKINGFTMCILNFMIHM